MSLRNHYVPQFILRQFGERLCLFDVQKQTLEEGRNPATLYYQKGIYPDEMETAFSIKVEKPFADLFYRKISPEKNEISLSRQELFIIKKFLLLSTLRTLESAEVIQSERNFYGRLASLWKEEGLPDEKIPEPPFKEKDTEGLTDQDYWLRTLRCIINAPDVNTGTIAQMPEATYAAFRWAGVIDAGYLGFWDASKYEDEFFLTDVGMTSENEVGWDEINQHNHKKMDFILQALQKDNGSSPNYTAMLLVQANFLTQLHENFMMFPISGKRMIVSISPFFKFRYEGMRHGYRFPSLNEYTKMVDENLFAPNISHYQNLQTGPAHFVYDKDDCYLYHPVSLSGFETRYCNALLMDRIREFLGFSSLAKAKRSVKLYKDLNEGFIPRVCYDGLYQTLHIK
jgi:hypothetical protein